MVSDIESFYLSVSGKLFTNAIQFSKGLRELVIHNKTNSEKLVINAYITCVEKDRNKCFVAPMESYIPRKFSKIIWSVQTGIAVCQQQQVYKGLK